MEEFRRDELLRDWINKRIILANAIQQTKSQQQQQHASSGGGDISLHQAAPQLNHGTVSTIDSLSEIHAPQVDATVHNSIKQPRDVRKKSIPSQEQPSQSHHALAHPHAQAPTALQDAIPAINDKATERTTEVISLKNTLKKITQKIQEKLKEFMPELDARLLQKHEQEQYMPQQEVGIASTGRKQDDNLSRGHLGRTEKGDEARLTQDVPIPDTLSVMRFASDNKSFVGRIDTNKRQRISADKGGESMTIEQPMSGCRESAPACAVDLVNGCDEVPTIGKPLNKTMLDPEMRQAKEKEMLSKLNQIINSIRDKNMRSAVMEDREHSQAKRKMMQQIYEHQIEGVESRICMYTKLEDLAKQIADVQTKVLANKVRTTTPNVGGALDMIHWEQLLTSFRLLEDTSDHLISTALKDGCRRRKS